MARLHAGRHRDAREDLLVALPALGNVCRLELLLLDLREGRPLEEVKVECARILAEAPAGGPLRAKACHVLGLVDGKLRHVNSAAEWLTEAAGIYRRLGDRAGLAQVQDTMGSLHASLGRLDLALCAYGLSLVEKTFEGDRFGMAITLGNLGRVHLRLGRLQDAEYCFELNRRIATELGDKRGFARILEDFGRTYMGQGEMAKARVSLGQCLSLSAREGYRDIECYARKDLALIHIQSGELEAAARELDLAEAALSDRPRSYLMLLLRAARGELLLARGDDAAMELLEDVARRFGELNLPDEEIPLRISLARAYSRAKLKQMADACLWIAHERAHEEGYERFLRPVREAMAEIGTVEEVRLERDRLTPAVAAVPPVAAAGYTSLACVGKGSFGSVYRAYDPIRDEIVAIKRIELGGIYDVQRRQQLLTSARLELETTARLRHPGIAKVLAIGEDRQGGIYLVQEYIRGETLRTVMDRGRPDIFTVLTKTKLICEALDALHRENIVHRDLKPANIIFRDPEGTPVLVDLGIAHLAGFDEGFDSSAIVGTVAYMAPEQVAGRSADPKMDLYSLGVILYEWIVGQLPKDEPQGEEFLREGLSKAIADSGEDEGEGGGRMARLCALCLSPEPRARPSARVAARTCSEALADMDVMYALRQIRGDPLEDLHWEPTSILGPSGDLPQDRV